MDLLWSIKDFIMVYKKFVIELVFLHLLQKVFHDRLITSISSNVDIMNSYITKSDITI